MKAALRTSVRSQPITMAPRPRKAVPLRANSLALNTIATDSRDFDKQTADTVIKMIEIVKRNVYEPVVIESTANALKSLSPFANDVQKMEAIFKWIKSHIRFQDDYSLANELIGMNGRHPDGEDFLIAPRLLLQMFPAKGDCDDFSMLAATMLLIAGLRTQFVTIAADATMPGLFSHVYVKAFVPSLASWIPFDCSHGTRIGWEYDSATRYQEWNIT